MKIDNTDNMDNIDNTGNIGNAGYSSNTGNSHEEDMELQILRQQNKLLMRSLQRAHDLNKNLLRVMRERSNARRGLSPKKEHKGYLVLSTSQYHQEYTEEIPFDVWKKSHSAVNIKLYRQYEPRTAEVWRTVIQTPYDASLPLQQLEHTIWKDFKEKGIPAEMGIQERCRASENGRYRNWVDDEGFERNGIYRWMFRAEFKTGLWNIELFHTLPVFVPEELRPR